ncbi:hypothetical protein SLEP1_g28465 [Rubroshorea leprosula]|uniref:Uncharacterized protein n=1 Tax=Rubroshorea leprosula TaxID=152421 RepID=A0AAV5JZF9_9ROSI|nr:hypothetical protein SLEP1_g28465 [Rubroshorea leprosula]
METRPSPKARSSITPQTLKVKDTFLHQIADDIK